VFSSQACQIAGNFLSVHCLSSIAESPAKKEIPLQARNTSVRRVHQLLWPTTIFLCLIGIAIVARRSVHLIPIVLHGYHPPAAPRNPAFIQFASTDDIFARHPTLTLIHILPALIFVTLGPLQFNRSLRARHPQWHRVSGRIYLIAATIVGASGLIMSFAMPAIGGVTQATATIVFSLYFLFALARAFLHIRRRDFALHREWMIRAFAIGLAVATIRPIVGLFVAVTIATRGPAALNLHTIFGSAFWLGFLVHITAAESWIRTIQVPGAVPQVD
jgi:uncharacterized membrane protein